jgi:hypothetical protein
MQISLQTLIMLARSGDAKAINALQDYDQHEASHPGNTQIYQQGSEYVIRHIIHPTPIYILTD